MSEQKLQSFIAKLDDRRVIEVKGEQAKEYLHGQITIDTNNFDESGARFSAHCDFKGKMFSQLLVSMANDVFTLSTSLDAAQASLEQFKKYAVFSKVEIEVSEKYQIVGASGDKAVSQLKQLFPNLDNEHLSVNNSQFGQAVCFNDTSLRYLCYITTDGLSQLSADDDKAHFDWLEIEAGIANIEAKNISQFVPQMLNLQCLSAIDFNKGCYMGQEVVARTKFLGKNKRASFILRATAPVNTLPTAGDTVEIQLGENWRKAGTLLRLAASPNNTNNVVAMAVLANDTEIGTILKVKGTDTQFTVESLPYELN